MAQPAIEILEISPPGALPHDLPHDVPDYGDNAGYHRPSMEQHMPDRGNYRGERRRSSARQSVIVSEPRDKYVYYKFIKQGRHWTEAVRRKMSVPQSQLEKMAKKGRRKVAEEKRSMGDLRGQHLDLLVQDLNADESGDVMWEPVFITKERVTTRDGIEVKSMDVVLARVPNSVVVKAGGGGGGTGELVVLRDKKPKDSEWSVGKKEKGGSHDHKRKDSKFDEDDDPFQSKPLFHNNGKPMDDYGPMNFDNAGLPPQIPHDRPIGSAPPKEKDKETDGRSKSKKGGSKDKRNSRTSVDDFLPGPLAGGAGPLGDRLDDSMGERKGKSRTRSRSAGYSEAMPGRRSRSRRRPSENRTRGSRSRSRAVYPDEVRFPPGSGRGGEWDVFSSSSVSSDRSRFGFEEQVDGSSHTSQDTYQSVVGRGSRYYDDGYEKHRSKSRGSNYRRDRKDYNEYSRGPPLRRARTDEAYQSPRARGYSMNGGGYYHDPLPESRQIDAPAGALMRRATYDDTRRPIVHYPSDMVDAKTLGRQRAAEGYMNGQARDEKFDRWERDLDRRERDIGRRERDFGRRESERGYHDDNRRYSRDDDLGYGGPYYDKY